MARWTPRPTASWPWCTSWGDGDATMDASCCSTIAGSSSATRRVARSESPSRSRLSGGSKKTGTKPARPRRLLRLGPPALPLSVEAQAGDDADDRPAPVAQVEERRRAADGLVVGVRGHVDDGGGHNEEVRSSPAVARSSARPAAEPRSRSCRRRHLSCVPTRRDAGVARAQGGPGRGGSLVLQVVGAGVGRTGTHSLKIALEHAARWAVSPHGRGLRPSRRGAGVDRRHRRAVPSTGHELMKGYTAQVDWPGSELLARALGGQPRRAGDPVGARAGLVVHELLEHHLRRAWPRWSSEAERVDDGHGRGSSELASSDHIGDRAAMTAALERHNERVRATIPARSPARVERRRTGGGRSASGSASTCPTSRSPRPIRRPSSGP